MREISFFIFAFLLVFSGVYGSRSVSASQLKRAGKKLESLFSDKQQRKSNQPPIIAPVRRAETGKVYTFDNVKVSGMDGLLVTKERVCEMTYAETLKGFPILQVDQECLPKHLLGRNSDVGVFSDEVIEIKKVEISEKWKLAYSMMGYSPVENCRNAPEKTSQYGEIEAAFLLNEDIYIIGSGGRCETDNNWINVMKYYPQIPASPLKIIDNFGDYFDFDYEWLPSKQEND
jgi:hypothetical protein